MSRRAGAALRTKKYERFRGVDFSTDPALVDDAHSPWAPNIVSGRGGMPEKRPGWRTLETFNARVNGIFHAVFDGVAQQLVHAGTKLYRREEAGETGATLLAESLPDARSTAVYMGGSLWIFTGGGLYRYDGVNAENAAVSAYAPLTVVARLPSGGGVSYEAINLLTGKQRVSFLADGASTAYQLPYTGLDSVDAVRVNGTAMTSGWTASLSAGTVTFSAAPAAPLAGAEDNVEITFSKTLDGYADRIAKCRVACVWGVGAASDRIVASGNPDYPNWDFICAYADGGYWPDTNYAVVGTDETAILGYRRLGDQLAVIKEDNGQDSTVFLRSGALDADGEAVFPIKPCLAGAGAVTRFGFGNIGDEQLLLTGSGVYALTTNSLTAERIAQNRSFRIDPKLLSENLSEATSCCYDGAYLIFAGGRVYGLDGRQPRAYLSRNDTAFAYECFYWEGVPARCAARRVEDGRETLFFGTADGRLCRFNTDVEGMARYNDDGTPIEAVWATRADDDGDPMVRKTLLPRGGAVTIKPYTRSSAKILFRTDRDAVSWQANQGTMDIFDWTDIDFSRVSFQANDAPAEIPFACRAKKYKRLQILVKNDVLNEGFGVYAIVKHFAAGDFAKK